jgi:hypothetical protein
MLLQTKIKLQIKIYALSAYKVPQKRTKSPECDFLGWFLGPPK